MRLGNCFFALSLAICGSAAAAPFQNLDFEATTLQPVPGSVSASAALPGWTVTLDTTVSSTVYGEPFVLDQTSVSLISSGDSDGPSPLQGNHSVQLYGYADAPTGYYHTATLSQTGDIPAGTRSVTFLTSSNPIGAPSANPFVTVNGIPVALFQTSVSNGIAHWSGDLTAFAGTTSTLAFTAAGIPGSFPTDEDVYSLDSIAFSTAPAPEPALLSLFALLPALSRSRGERQPPRRRERRDKRREYEEKGNR